MDNKILEKIKEAVRKASPFGSVEIIIQAGQITQVSYRHIEKTELGTMYKEHRNTLDVDQFGRIVDRKKGGDDA